MSFVKVTKSISVDRERDVFLVFGHPIAGEVLRALAMPTPEGLWFRIVDRGDGVASIQMNVDEHPAGATLQ